MSAQTNPSRLEAGYRASVAYIRRPGRGAAHPLLLLHGIGSNAQSFVPLMSALPDSIDAIAWNAPGYADSAPLPDPSPLPHDYAAALEKLLDAFKLARAALAGHSLGALFAGSFAARHPRRVTALALLSPAAGYRCSSGTPLPASVQSRIDEIVELGPIAFAARRAARLVGDPQGMPNVVAAVERAMASVNPAGYVQAVRALGGGDLCADVARISNPAVVVVGAMDQITPPPGVRAVHAAFRQPTPYHEIAGAGHALPQEKPEAIAELLGTFVARTGDA